MYESLLFLAWGVGLFAVQEEVSRDDWRPVGLVHAAELSQVRPEGPLKSSVSAGVKPAAARCR